MPVSNNASFGSRFPCWQQIHGVENCPVFRGDRLRSVCPSACRGVQAATVLLPPQRVTWAEDSHGMGTPHACAVWQGAMKFSGAFERGRKIELDAVLKGQIEKTTPG